MTVEQKAKAYDEALEKAKEFYALCKKCGAKDTVDFLEDNFPELRESEDGRIRKEFCKDIWTFIPNEKAHKYIAWLEKQNSNVDNANKEYWRGYREGKQEILDKYAELEKQGEQNLADNVKPKFKVGDWISNDMCDVHIASIENGMYYFDEGDGLSIVFVDEHYHLWTIEDAMDGDVLTYKNDNVEWILIYKNIMSETCDVPHDVLKYHALFTGTVFYDSGSAGMISENYALCFTPSTKEQRELLFQKIKEAGYIFDFKNKELKKIETEIEIPFGAKDSELQEATYYIPKGFHAEIDDDKVVIKKGEKPTAWSEKDEKMFEYALNMIEWYSGKNEDKSRFVSDWLKSLRPHKQWKPSEEQMEALHNLNLTGCISYVGQGQTLIELYNDLKKLTE